MNTDLTLFYDRKIIGTLKSPFLVDGTWHAFVQLKINGKTDELECKLLAFIQFVESWNEKVRSGAEMSVGDFDHYTELINSNSWHTKDADGKVRNLLDAPVFFRGEEISWRVD